MVWYVDLDGKPRDIEYLSKFAPHCGCKIQDSPDGRPSLTGQRFDSCANADDVRAEAEKTVTQLNGIAGLNRSSHNPVNVGTAVYELSSDGRKSVHVLMQAGIRFGSAGAIDLSINGRRITIDPEISRAERVFADQRCLPIIEAFAGNVTWQKLRVAFERFRALAGGSDNRIIQGGYATREELTQFKSNAEDPRHSGIEAVHGVPKGPHKGTKMTISEGRRFIVRMLDAYLDGREAG